MSMHYQIVAPQAMHQWCFVSSTDPALDPNNQVTANKAWFNSTFLRLYVRNAANTAWRVIGQ